MSSAKLVATTDLPSLGSDDVIPITLFCLIDLLMSVATLTARTPSANADNGSSTTYRNGPTKSRLISFANPTYFDGKLRVSWATGADKIVFFRTGKIVRQLVFKICFTCFGVRKTL